MNYSQSPNLCSSTRVAVKRMKNPQTQTCYHDAQCSLVVLFIMKQHCQQQSEEEIYIISKYSCKVLNIKCNNLVSYGPLIQHTHQLMNVSFSCKICNMMHIKLSPSVCVRVREREDDSEKSVLSVFVSVFPALFNYL